MAQNARKFRKIPTSKFWCKVKCKIKIKNIEVQIAWKLEIPMHLAEIYCFLKKECTYFLADVMSASLHSTENM